MTERPDFGNATGQLARLLDGITDDQLTAPTPCEKYVLGDLIDHVGGLCVAFAAAAAKDLGEKTSRAPSGDAGRLGGGWRASIPWQLTALAAAWRDPAAWAGMTQVGGIDLPAEVAATVALNELTVHGWDIARASGQPFDGDPAAVEAAIQFAAAMSAPDQQAGRAAIFGPVVDVPADATLLNRLIGLSGRDPGWAPGPG
jgi:uncharacterized protein (TIGR03086 family)